MCAANFVDIILDSPGTVSPDMDRVSYSKKDSSSSIIVSTSSRKHSFGFQEGGWSFKSVITGTEQYVTPNSRYTVVPGNYLVLNEGTGYTSSIDHSDPVESFTVYFGARLGRRFFAAMLAGHDTIPEPDTPKNRSLPEFVERTYLQDDKIGEALQALYGSVKAGMEEDELMEEGRLGDHLRHLLFGLLTVHLAVRVEINSIKAARPSTRAEVYKRLNYARDYMESSYHESISVDRIAHVACMNTEYFIRQFKKQFSTTPVQYLIAKRMKAAGKALQQGHCTVSEVCRRVGYSDITSFGKLFKRYYGQTPEAYYRDMRKAG